MGNSETYQEAEIQRTAIFALDTVTGVFRACRVAPDGTLQTTAGSGGGGTGGDVRIKDATLSQFATVDASGRLTVNVAGTVPVSGTVAVSNFPATQPVSGTLAVTGPLTDAQLRASAVPVSLASVPSHPVTGPLTDAQLRATPVPVSGTFWQATQPVSGTFWQATQPVSGPLTDAQLRAAAVPVSLATLPAGVNNIGDVDVLTLPALPAGTNRIGSVRPVDSADADLTSAKYTQPLGRALAVNLIRDLGRTLIFFLMGAGGTDFVTTQAADMLATFARSVDGAALVDATDYQVTAGKRLRIVGGQIAERSGTGNSVGTNAIWQLRINTAGVVVVSSPMQIRYYAAHPATASTVSASPPFAPSWGTDGPELQAGWHFGISVQSSGWTATTQVPVWTGHLLGYEY